MEREKTLSKGFGVFFLTQIKERIEVPLKLVLKLGSYFKLLFVYHS